MEYAFPDMKFSVVSLDEKEICIQLDDSEGYTFEGGDTYVFFLNYEEHFYDDALYNCSNIENCIDEFTKVLKNEMRKTLPESEEFDNYECIEGFWECLGIVKAACKPVLQKLWSEFYDEAIADAKKLLDKIDRHDITFDERELSIIRTALKDEVLLCKKEKTDKNI